MDLPALYHHLNMIFINSDLLITSHIMMTELIEDNLSDKEPKLLLIY